MNHKITKSFLLMAFMLLAATASAYDVEIDGIYYDLSYRSAKVTYGTYGSPSYSGDVVIPSTFTHNGNEYTVTDIRSDAFRNCTELTSVVIPNTVTYIGEYAFQGCSSLTSFNIPEQVTVISRFCFAECASLDSVVIPEGVTEIDACAFIRCSNLTTITFPESITKIGASIVQETPWFESQPDGLVYIGKIAYKYKGSIPNNCEIVIREGTVCISGECFWEWSTTGLTSITIPNSVRSIGFGAFYDCGNLTSITLPEGLEEIEDIAFAHCYKLTEVTIPASVKSLGERVFDCCYALGSITVDPGNTVYDSRNNCNAIIRTNDDVLIEGCNNTVIVEGVKSIGRCALTHTYLTEVPMPYSLKTIGTYAFQFSERITNLVLTDSLTTVGDYAFRYCTGLNTVSIGSGVKRIGVEAFAQNYRMTDVYCYAVQLPSTSTSAFLNSRVNENTVLHVPYESLEQYRTTAPWNEFKEIVPLSLPKCATPTITLLPGGRVKVESETPGAICETNVTACNEEPITAAEFSLHKSLVLYTVTAVASAPDHEPSDVATATFRIEEPDTDVNGDGVIDVEDVVQLINIVLNQP